MRRAAQCFFAHFAFFAAKHALRAVPPEIPDSNTKQGGKVAALVEDSIDIDRLAYGTIED